ncbi:MAG: efflux RND transporter periplasmic adaptor subunit [Nitrospinae bacterium]|nr:efflux RND transporter periplasmic adaptor subunit [Nitrospinota bacterium]
MEGKPSDKPPGEKPDGGRKNALIKLAGAFALAASLYGAYWLFHGRFHETTDNAYVTGNLISIEPQVAGSIISIGADETDFVKKGSVLVRLDGADTQVALEKAKAELAENVRRAGQMIEQVEQAKAGVSLKEAELSKARDEFERRKTLEQSGAISREDFDRAKTAYDVAGQALRGAVRQLKGAQALAPDKDVRDNPAVKLAMSKAREAHLAWKRTVIVSPVEGYVAKRGAQAGQRVAPGRPLMTIAPVAAIRVEANFKENQLSNMRIGQSATLTSDMYGGSVVFHGKVAGIVAGTGSVFSLLPPQNATGNWIKIVQRVPVKIDLDPAEVAAHPLFIGLSMKADVNTSDRSGKALATVERGKEVYGTEVYAAQSEGADEMIEEIINGAKPAR